MRSNRPLTGTTAVYSFDLTKRKQETIISGVEDFRISFNGEKMLYRQDDAWAIAEPKAGDKETKWLKTDGLEVSVEPRAEWRQMYHEVWRIERDFFYDPNTTASTYRRPRNATSHSSITSRRGTI